MNTSPPGDAGGEDAQTGSELRQFFLELLQETNLRAYHEDRDGYIRRRLESGDLGEEAERLLREGTLEEIEQQLKLVTGSDHAWPVMIVFPPI